jgi:hypothetical protein
MRRKPIPVSKPPYIIGYLLDEYSDCYRVHYYTDPGDVFKLVPINEWEIVLKHLQPIMGNDIKDITND